MNYRFCEVFTYQKQLFLVRRANANGPDCLVLPPQRLDPGTTPAQLASELRQALDAYVALGRSIDPIEWDERGQQLLAFFGETSNESFRRQVREITIRQDLASGTFSLFGGHGANLLCELPSLADVASRLFDLLGARLGAAGETPPLRE